MSATVSELTMFRNELDITADVMDDDVVNAIFDEAESDYAGNGRIVIRYAAYEKAIVWLVNRAARLADYKANEAEEKLSQIATQLEKRLSYYQQKLADALGKDTLPAVQWGATHRKPPRRRDLPNSW